MGDRSCGRCGGRVRSGEYVCRGCGRQLADSLTGLSGLLDDLRDASGGLMHYYDAPPRITGGAAYRVLIREDVSRLRSALESAVTRAVMAVAVYRGESIPLTTARVESWLIPRIMSLRAVPESVDIIDDLMSLLARCRAIIDRPTERSFAGRCPHCDSSIYAEVGADTGVCARCGQGVCVSDQRQAMLARAEDACLTAIECSRAMAIVGVHVGVSTIRAWAQAGRIVAVDHGGPRGSARFRLGDVSRVSLASSGV